VHAFVFCVHGQQGPYELCDAVRGSDHRPVSQAFFLKVNGAIYGSTIGDLIPMKLSLKEVGKGLAMHAWAAKLCCAADFVVFH
jgi:hypothetical protein